MHRLVTSAVILALSFMLSIQATAHAQADPVVDDKECASTATAMNRQELAIATKTAKNILNEQASSHRTAKQIIDEEQTWLYGYSNSSKGYERRVLIGEFDGKKYALKWISRSGNVISGELFRISSAANGAFADTVFRFGVRDRTYVCIRMNMKCAKRNCGAAAIACGAASGVAYAACLIISCPVASAPCCTKYGNDGLLDPP